MKSTSRRRSEHLRWVVAAAGMTIGMAGGVARPAAAQQEMSDVEITATRVAGNVYMLQGRGGNIGVSVGSDGVLLVDDQYAPLSDKIRAALSEIVGGAVELEFVLNTHWHGDHVGGNVEFGAEAPVIAHTNVRERMSTRQETSFGVVEPSPPEALPVLTFGDSVSIHFNGEEIRAIHYPHGHTDGDAVIFFTGSNVVHMGDVHFAGLFPFIDVSSGGSVRGVIDAVTRVVDQVPSDASVIPGHGPLSTVDDLREYVEMLEESVALVENGIRAGKSLEDLKAEGVPERWAGWSWGFIDGDRWIEIVHGSLQGS
jgi:glyoxylase-like metal-dependent hydrolase (beta-lactamase superfamily II)